MSDSNYSVAGIHLPEKKILITRLEKLSHIINDVVLVVSVLVLIGWIANFSFSESFFLRFLDISPMTAMLFIAAGSILLFSAKQFSSRLATTTNTILPILCGLVVALFGFINIFIEGGMPPMIGFNFYLLGLALIFPYIKFTHRFHAAQFIIFSIIVINSSSILGHAYQSMSPFTSRLPIDIPLATSLMFNFFCLGVLLRWANRGFLSSFTAESTGSTLALRVLIINLLTAPAVGFFILILIGNGIFMSNLYQAVALTVILIMVVSTILAWFNIKLLYTFELEHFLMKEALRVHKIDYTLEKEEQNAKMTELEYSKQKYLDKLNYQDKFRDIAERLG